VYAAATTFHVTKADAACRSRDRGRLSFRSVIESEPWYAVPRFAVGAGKSSGNRCRGRTNRRWLKRSYACRKHRSQPARSAPAAARSMSAFVVWHKRVVQAKGEAVQQAQRWEAVFEAGVAEWRDRHACCHPPARSRAKTACPPGIVCLPYKEAARPPAAQPAGA